MFIFKIRNPKHETRNKKQIFKNFKFEILNLFRISNFDIRICIFLLFFLTPSLFAAKYDIKEMTPAVESALQNRQSRYSQIKSMKDGGILGENNQGYVKVLKTLPEADSLASAENADRRTIYQAIVEQNNLPSDGLSQVQAVFAEVQREKAGAGDFVQLPSGDWVKK